MRICLWAGAGAGKSTVAAGIFCELKKKGHSVELVHEYIKKWAYEKKVPKSFDQIYVFGKQLNAEDVLLNSGVEHIITDSPVAMQTFYARKYNFVCWRECLAITRAFDAQYKPLHIFLDRTGIPYKQNGRYEDEEQAKMNDAEMQFFMDSYLDTYTSFNSTDSDGILSFVGSRIEFSVV